VVEELVLGLAIGMVVPSVALPLKRWRFIQEVGAFA